MSRRCCSRLLPLLLPVAVVVFVCVALGRFGKLPIPARRVLSHPCAVLAHSFPVVPSPSSKVLLYASA